MSETAKMLREKILEAFVAHEHEVGARHAKAYAELDQTTSGLNFVIALIEAENRNFSEAIRQVNLLRQDEGLRAYYDVHLPLLLSYFHHMEGDNDLAKDFLREVNVPSDFIYMDVLGNEISVSFVTSLIHQASSPPGAPLP